MGQDNGMAFIILLGIIGIMLFGGSKNADSEGLLSLSRNETVEQPAQNPEPKESQSQEFLKSKIKEEETNKSLSQYHGIVTLYYLDRSTNPTQEYLTIRVSGSKQQVIPVTGWTIRSVNNGTSVTIPKGVYIFFAGMANGEENISLTGGDTMYVVTGASPIGTSFKVNKCSGYLAQFQTFYPHINSNCPVPSDEDLSGIPNTSINDACLRYIESFPSCRIETGSLPANWSYECTNFITNKINYPSCVNTHKNDNDFQSPEWRVYLRRNNFIWKKERDAIILYDAQGKVVDSMRY